MLLLVVKTQCDLECESVPNQKTQPHKKLFYVSVQKLCSRLLSLEQNLCCRQVPSLTASTLHPSEIGLELLSFRIPQTPKKS